ncbi:retrotransposon-like protein 1 [Desmophyllum pertusum]|uniref:Retrotransposon-like protein 1 n=1 Tax=Desmophyllum pertusum TaxID=174260 RepID=A0A9W9ZQR4_9CNID|nr:retrotransposon-like protein 1 [Desmophyllum pertusum]
MIAVVQGTADYATMAESFKEVFEEINKVQEEGKFKSGDIALWLRQFDTCALANGWSEVDKLRKLPAFLRGRAATYYYALRDEQKESYDALARHLKESLCPKVDREKCFAEFEHQTLRTGEDPAVFLWELTQLLEKANPSLPAERRTALLERQFMRGLPARTRLKLLEQVATRTLDAMVAFAQ